ncbi:hypothetical protein F4803DRAFT_527211 [Xylaria telfairii]|nr:hypothetical protein F4803DRAFT_527211 [Xylaria telfairii]
MSRYTTNHEPDVNLPLRAFRSGDEIQPSPRQESFSNPILRHQEESETSTYSVTNTPQPWTTSQDQIPSHIEYDRSHLAELARWQENTSNDFENDLHSISTSGMQSSRMNTTALPLYDTPLHRPSLDSNSEDYGVKASTSRRIGSYIRWWYLDIIAVVISFASLGAIIGILVAYNGKSQSAWPSDVLTINGLVAILATVCRGSFMISVGSALSQEKWNRFAGAKNALGEFSLFDEASKGSWGSLKLLSRFKVTHPGCLGAALTVLALAFSTFSQQLIIFESNVLSEAPTPMASVPRSTYVNTVNGVGNAFNPTLSTKLAIYNGFMSSTITYPSASCPTGNCTWPVIPTMGVCGSCVDLTSEIKVNKSTSSFCAVTVGSLNLTGSCDSKLLDFMPIFTVGRGSGRVFERVDDIQWDSPNLIGTFGALGLPGSKTLSSGLDGSVATECALWYCLQAHEVGVELGETRDRVIRSWNRATSLAPGSTNGNITFTSIPDEMNVNSTDLYGMPNMQVLGMSQYINKTFIGGVNADGGLGVIAPTTDFAEGMQRSLDDPDSWIDRLARSMTNDIRLNQSVVGTSTQYDGTTSNTGVIIIVRWPWIAYPASLVFLSFVYLVYIITYTAQLPVRPWKSDALLPLCLQLDNDLKAMAAEGADKPGGIEERIGRYRVKLDMPGNRLVGLTREGE